MDSEFEDPSARILGIVFMAPVAGYVLVTPGAAPRKTLNQVVRAVATVLVAATIIVVSTGSDWHVSHATIYTQYGAFSNRKVEGALAIRIGLGSATVQLQGSVPDLPLDRVDYNEKFSWNRELSIKLGVFTRAGDMKRHYKDALLRGLPYPILTAAEYLSLDNDVFRWGRHYRQAGYYTYFCLWSAFVLWLLSNILWPVDILYGAVSIVTTGLTLLITNVVYTFNLSKRELAIPYEGQTLEFTYGWCYYLTAAVGIVCLLFGSSISVIRLLQSQQHLQSYIMSEKFNSSLEESTSWKRHFSKYSKLHDDNTNELCRQR